MNLSDISGVVAADIRRFETSLNGAIRDGASLLVTLVDSGEKGKLDTSVLHPVVVDVTASLTALVSGQTNTIGQAHRRLEKIGRRLGLTETDWGTPVTKMGYADLPAPISPRPAVGTHLPVPA